MKKIVVIAYDEESVKAYVEQVKYFMGSYAEVLPYSIKENTIEHIEPADLYLLSTYAYSIKNRLSLQGEVVIIRVTMKKAGLMELLKVPPKTKALLVNISYKTAIDTITLFNQLGIDNIEFYPYSPNEPYAPNINFAVTPGESRYVPKEITNVLDIGSRVLSSDTVVEIFLKLQCKHLMQDEKVKAYFDELVDNNYNFNHIFRHSVQMEGLFNILQNILDIGIICMDEDSEVFFCNKKAEEVLNLSGKKILGEKIVKTLDFIPFQECFSTHCKVKEQIVNVNNIDITLNVVPVLSGDTFIGAMAIVQKFSDEEYRQHKLRCQLMNKGHMAKYTFDSIVGSSPTICHVKEVAEKMAKRSAPILLTGESGTGKELFAHAIHAVSKRSKFPFVAINCAAIPDNLMESELFGYEEGAFTGAKKGGKMGYFEFAHKGTLFLDEIEGMSQSLQLKLLRVIQEKEVLRVGGNRIISVDVRMIAATNEDLEKKVLNGEFRKDLYYRLNVLSLELPPLRERGRDILQLLDKFRQEINADFLLTSETEEILLAQSWEGNIRQLRNCVEYLACLEKSIILPEDLPSTLYKTQRKNICGNQDQEKAAVFFRDIKKEPFVQEEPTRFFQNDDGLKKFLLLEIEQCIRQGKNHGRRFLMQRLKEVGYYVTEQKLRTIMKQMQEQNLIEIKKGRGGSSITENGVKWINEDKNKKNGVNE